MVAKAQKASQIVYTKQFTSSKSKYTPYTDPVELDRGMQYQRRQVHQMVWGQVSISSKMY